MSLLGAWLPAALLLGSVLSDSTDIWTIPYADEVSAVEGGSAVLPCTVSDFTLPFSVSWLKGDLRGYKPVANCTYPSPFHSQCNNMIQEGEGSRITFVGNFSQGDASIMVQRLKQADSGQYRCHIPDSSRIFKSVVLTHLMVRASDGKDSEVTGTEGASATLPCVFTRSRQSLTAHTVTWMRKDPYRHIVTFRRIQNGSWAAENGVTRYELVGDPELGNSSTRIKQLRVEDSHSYLCLAEFRTRTDLEIISPSSIHLSQYEAHLWVRPVKQTFAIVLLCIPLEMKIFTLLVMGIILCKLKLRDDPD
ncbi:immunoglobulin superfamily member 3-like isoform X2 [Hemitrygon akajei]|uniref:immunoglobulin superfamily member 3-like isoform X2 n=1 Tax=Hemitrygon akajei TaxID=2704970 RepID=UPI003BF96573